MYVHIGKAQIIRITEIIAVIHYEHYVPAAFLRLLVPMDEVKSFIVTDDYVFGSPYRASAIVKKVKEQKL